MLFVVLATPLLLLARGVRHAREAANGSQCQGHLKYLIINLHNYHSVNGSFPPGTVPNPGLPPERRLGWLVELWPQMFFDSVPMIDKTKAWDAAPNWPLKLGGAPGVTFVGRTLADTDRGMTCPDDPASPGPIGPRPLTYPGIAGLGLDAPRLPSGHPRAGVFGSDRTTRLSDITDGTAETMALVESGRGLAPWSAGGPSSVRGVDPKMHPQIGPGRPFGGYHPGGANVAMADGSVKFVRDTVAPAVFEALSTIAGGESIPSGWDNP